MTPKHWDFFITLLEAVAQESYAMGYSDAEEKKPKRDKGFKPTKATVLVLKTNLEKHVRTR